MQWHSSLSRIKLFGKFRTYNITGHIFGCDISSEKITWNFIEWFSEWSLSLTFLRSWLELAIVTFFCSHLSGIRIVGLYYLYISYAYSSRVMCLFNMWFLNTWYILQGLSGEENHTTKNRNLLQHNNLTDYWWGGKRLKTSLCSNAVCMQMQASPGQWEALSSPLTCLSCLVGQLSALI